MQTFQTYVIGFPPETPHFTSYHNKTKRYNSIPPLARSLNTDLVHRGIFPFKAPRLFSASFSDLSRDGERILTTAARWKRFDKAKNTAREPNEVECNRYRWLGSKLEATLVVYFYSKGNKLSVQRKIFEDKLPVCREITRLRLIRFYRGSN